MADPNLNSKGQRALIHELLGFPSFWIEGDLCFYLLFWADLSCFLDLPASTKGQASEASWFPGLWVNSIL